MIRQFAPSDLGQLTVMIQAGYNISAKRIGAYFGSAKTMVYDDGAIRGFCAMRPPRQDHGHTVMGVRVYTDPTCRRTGVARALWDAMWPEIRRSPADLVDTAYRLGPDDVGNFFADRGFKRWFVNYGMRYDGPRFPEPTLAWRPYDDCYFEDYLRLINVAFEPMRRGSDIEPYVIFSEKSFEDDGFRREMADNRDNMFVFLDGDRVIGLTELVNDDGNNVESLAVAPEYHGRGIGRQIIRFAINRLRDRGVEHIYLDTVETNMAARRLYESVGFVLDQRVEEARLWLR